MKLIRTIGERAAGPLQRALGWAEGFPALSEWAESMACRAVAGHPWTTGPWRPAADALADGWSREHGRAFLLERLRRIHANAQRIESRYRGLIPRCATSFGAGFPDAPAVVRTAAGPGGPVELIQAQLTADRLEQTIRRLRGNGRAALEKFDLGRLLQVLDAASREWLRDSGDRDLAVEAIHRLGGFSRESVLWSMELEMRSSLAADMKRALAMEFPSLENLLMRGEGRALRHGPALLGAVFSSNIPALPHLTYMRGLITGSPVLGRCSSDEPVFTPLYLQTLARLEPALAEAIACAWWPSDDAALTQLLVSQSGHLVVYGGEQTIAHFHRLIRPGQPATFHGHRLGVTLIDAAQADDLQALGFDIAMDHCTFDGAACLSPRVVFVSGGKPQTDRLAAAIAAAMNTISSLMPGPLLGVEQRARRRVALDEWEFGGQDFISGASQGWVMLRTSGEWKASSLPGRFIHLHDIGRLDQALDLLIPIQRWLQNAALLASPEDAPRLAGRLAALGVSRIVRPGRMATPTMMWRHDGRPCLGDLVRWTDIRL
ncbi:MAG: hypothetical protein GMKNLPBB_01783 [Myxococcota bacterium]|nr:hypothetical protein [Myxococcota bacterium]